MSENKKLPWSELRLTPEYQKLTAKQQLFVGTYCEGGMIDGTYDAVGATMTAYKCKSHEIARIMSYSLLANIRIVAALNRHFNATPTAEFMETLDRAIRNKKLSTAQLGALKLKADILGLKTMIPDQQTPIERKIETVVAHEKAAKKSKKKESKAVQPVEPTPVPDSLKGFLR